MTPSTRYMNFSILGLSIFSLAIAFIVEYVMHLPVCPLCVYQRFPFLVLICISICALQDNSKSWFNWYIVCFIVAIFLAGYHTGVENGIFEMSSFCKPAISIPDNFDIADFRKMLDSISAAQCDKPALKIFTLSMTEWNLLLNIFLLTIALIVKLRINTSLLNTDNA